ncbi:MAG: right-handed parallel beta-helix repeat-containing protein [Promethearchaeota archaeon]|jgi:hypothetical protein
MINSMTAISSSRQKFYNKAISTQFMFFAFIIIAIFFINFETFATDYYVALNGFDSNSGLDSKHPWKTIPKVNSRSFDPGDRILFRRGDIWLGEQLYLASSGDSTAKIVYTAYGTGNRPIIDSRGEVSGWNNIGNWIRHSTTVWYISLSDDPWRLWLSETEYVEANASAADPVSLIDNQYRWYYDDANDLLYVYSEGHPATDYTAIIGLHPNSSAIKGEMQYVEISELDLRGGYDGCIQVWNSIRGIIRDCDIGYSHMGIRLSGSRHFEIYNCTVDSKANYTYNYEYYNIGDGLLAKGIKDCIIRNNQFMDWGHTAIYLPSKGAGTEVLDNEIYENFISASHISYGRGFSLTGPEGTCKRNRFYRNLIKNTSVSSQLNGQDNYVYHNIIEHVENSPGRPYATGHGITIQGYGENVCHDNHIYNNIFIDCWGAAIVIRGNPGDLPKYNNKIVNNIMFNCGIMEQGLTLLIHDDDTVLGNIFKNNCMYNENFSNLVNYRGSRMPIAEFELNNHNNADTIIANIQDNPIFKEVITSNFQLQSISPCIDAGLDVGLSQDYDGTSIPQGAGVDVGAYEFNSRSPQRPTDLRIEK